jgi:hypothetical protein
MTDTISQSPARRLHDEKRAAAYLNVSPRTLQSWRRKGGGPRYIKLGAGTHGPVRYDQQDLDDFIDARARANTAV